MAINSQQAAKSRKERASKRRQQEQLRNILVSAGGILAVVVLIWFLINNGSPVQNVVPARVGSPLGDFSLQDTNGKTVHLSDYKGKNVLINAWATWCPPCKAEMPLLNQYYQAHAQQDFTLLAINAGDTQPDAASFAVQNGLLFPILLDPDIRLLNQLGINSFPTSILIGKDGKVKTIHVGMFTQEAIESEITSHLE